MRHTIASLLLAVAPGLAAVPPDANRSLPLFFVPNSGQADPSLRYVAQTPELRAGFALDSAVFQMHETGIRVRFAGANPKATIHSLDAMAARVNFLMGD